MVWVNRWSVWLAKEHGIHRAFERVFFMPQATSEGVFACTEIAEPFTNAHSKCDEGKPQCQRCQKAGRVCPGYRDPSRIKIRDMTATTINRFEYDRYALRPKGDEFFDQNYSQSVMTLCTRADEEAIQNQAAYAIDDGDRIDETRASYMLGSQNTMSEEGSNDSILNYVTSKPTLQVPPRTSTQQHSFVYFINHWLNVTPQGLDPGYLDVLKLATGRPIVGMCLNSCLSTLALAAFSRRPASRKVTVETQTSYSVALKAVNNTIGKPGAIFDDELLTSIVILALVEVRCCV